MLVYRLGMPGKRFTPSGRNVRAAERHTVVLQIRLQPELAAKARALCAEKDIPLSRLLAAGIEAVTGGLAAPGPLAADEDGPK